MSALAKVFVVIILLLALVFFGTSSTLFLTREDLKSELSRTRQEYSAKLTELEKKISEFAAAKDLQENALVASKTNNVNLSLQLDQARAQVTAEKARADAAEAARDNAVRLNATANERLAATETRNQELQNQVQETVTRRDAAVASQRQAIEERNRMARDLEQANKELQQQKIAYVDLSNKYDELELRWTALVARFDGAIPSTPAAPLDALIEAIHPELKAVVLSVGRDQEVKIGDEFTIHRGGRYVGKVKVIKLYRDLSGARVLYEKDGESIQVGDNATTRVGTFSS